MSGRRRTGRHFGTISPKSPNPPDLRHSRHFFGSIVTVPYDPAPGHVSRFLVIDGQQRLTTVSIILMVLRDLATEHNLPALAQEIEETYLLYKFKTGDERFKLHLREKDRIPYLALLSKQYIDGRTRLAKASAFFRKQLEALIDQGAVPGEALATWRDLATDGLQVVAIRLLPEDNPFEIFASLNFKGEDLTEADLIRNLIFMHVPVDEQETFDKRYWKPFEDRLDALANLGTEASEFYRHYLLRSGGSFIRKKETYLAFQKRYKAESPTPGGKVSELTEYAGIYLNLVSPKTLKGVELAPLRQQLNLLNALEVSTSYPLLLNLFARWKSGTLSQERLTDALVYLNSFVVRRNFCAVTNRPYNKWFVEIVPKSSDSDPLSTVVGALKNKGWPSNDEFRRGLLEFPLYGPNYGKAILERLLREEEKTQLGGEAADVRGCQIEHILPQSVSEKTDRGRDWIQMLGPDWRNVHDQCCDAIANLTLLGKGLNFRASNDTFAAKKPILAKSIVCLNRHFDSVTKWDQHAMVRRLSELALLAYSAFPLPPTN